MPTREEIARIIDPEAWAGTAAPSDRMHNLPSMEVSLRKADAILALDWPAQRQARAEGLEEAAQELGTHAETVKANHIAYGGCAYAIASGLYAGAEAIRTLKDKHPT